LDVLPHEPLRSGSDPHADVVERLASSSSVVQLVAYRCSEPVPEVVARGEQP
jgi:hypothetical protein